MRIQIWLVVMGLWGVHCRQPAATPSDISSINSLRDKSAIALDPKLRRALLRVLNKLEMEDKGNLPIGSDMELSDEEFLKIFGQQANSEDLGSLESKETVQEQNTPEAEVIKDKLIEHYTNQDYNFIPPIYQNKQNETPLMELEAIVAPSHNVEEHQDENLEQNLTNQEYTYLPTPSVEQPDQSLVENHPTKPTPDSEAIFFQVPTPIDIPDLVEDQNPIEVEDKDELEEIPPTIFSSTESVLEVTNDDRIKKDANVTTENTVESSVSLSEEIKEGNKTKPDKKLKHEVEFLQSSLIAAFTLQQDDKGNPKRVIPLEYVQNQPALVEKRQRELEQKEYLLQQQLRTLQEEKYRVQGALKSNVPVSQTLPPPIAVDQFQSEGSYYDAQRQQELQRQQEQQKLVELQRQQEFLRQQELQRQQEILSIQRQEEQKRQQESQRVLELENNRNFHSQDFQRPINSDFDFNRQQEIQRQQEQQRQQEFQRQQEQQRHEAYRQRQQELQRFQQLPPASPTLNQGVLHSDHDHRNFFPNHRFQFNNQRKPFQEIEFQKSIDFRLPHLGQNSPTRQPFLGGGRSSPIQSQFVPGIELNRVNRHEPSQFVGNFATFPRTVDHQLQNLLVQTGVSQYLPSDNKDDLNIVSKVLSFNHLPGELAGRPTELVNRYATPPSRIVEPPNF